MNLEIIIGSYIVKHIFDEIEIFHICEPGCYYSRRITDATNATTVKNIVTGSTKYFNLDVVQKTYADGKIFYEVLNEQEFQTKYPEYLI